MKSIVALLISVLLAFCAAAMGAAFPAGEYYSQIAKPSWSPPGWLFGPVWTVLYLMMAVAAWLVWRKHGAPHRKRALTLYGVQLALNALWTPIFFGMHEIGLAAAELFLLWLALLGTVIAFWRVSRSASLLLLPYHAWVSFAAFLNFTLWRMN